MSSSSLEKQTQYLKEMNYQKIQSLKETIEKAITKIYEDDLLSTMKQNSTTQQFIGQRIQEIFQEIFNSQREQFIDKITIQYAELKGQYYELTVTKQSYDHLIQQNSRSNDEVFKKEILKLKEKLMENNKIIETFQESQQNQIYSINELNDENKFLTDKCKNLEKEITLTCRHQLSQLQNVQNIFSNESSKIQKAQNRQIQNLVNKCMIVTDKFEKIKAETYQQKHQQQELNQNLLQTRKENDRLQKQIQELKIQNTDYISLREKQFQQEIQQFKQIKEGLIKDYTKKESQYEDIKSKYDEQQLSIDALQQQLDQYKKQQFQESKLQQIIQVANDTIQDLKKQSEQQIQDHAQLKTQLESEIQKLQKKLNDKIKLKTEEIDSLKRLISQLEIEIDAKILQNEDQQKQFNECQEMNDYLNDEIIKLKQKNENLIKENKKVKSQLQDKNNQEDKQTQEQEVQIKEYENCIEQLNLMIMELSKQLKQSQNDLEFEQNQKLELESYICKVCSKIQMMKSIIKNELKNLKEDLKSIQFGAFMDKNFEKIIEIEKENYLEQFIKEKEYFKEEVMKEIEQKEFCQQVKCIRQENEDLNNENQSLINLLENSESQIKQISDQLNEMIQANSQMGEQMKVLEKELQDKIQENENNLKIQQREAILIKSREKCNYQKLLKELNNTKKNYKDSMTRFEKDIEILKERIVRQKDDKNDGCNYKENQKMQEEKRKLEIDLLQEKHRCEVRIKEILKLQELVEQKDNEIEELINANQDMRTQMQDNTEEFQRRFKTLEDRLNNCSDKKAMYGKLNQLKEISNNISLHTPSKCSDLSLMTNRSPKYHSYYLK